MDSLFGTNMQNASLPDTMWDLIVAVIGASIMAYFGARFVVKPKKGLVAKWLKRFVDANPHLAGKGGR
jgi:uncharacterized protein YacL